MQKSKGFRIPRAYCGVGGWNAVFILLERRIGIKKGSNSIILSMYTLFVVNIGWVLFRAESVSNALKYLRNMFIYRAANGMTVGYYLNSWNVSIGIIAIILSGNMAKRLYNYIDGTVGGVMLNCIFLLLFFISILSIVSGTYNPFIYYQF